MKKHIAKVACVASATVIIMSTLCVSAQETYTVQKNDYLYSISEKYYGNGKDWSKIYDANQDKIRNPQIIRVGQSLIIPDAEAEKSTVLQQMYDSRSLGLTSVENARQEGGIMTTDGRHVKNGLLLRTASLDNLSEADAQTLAQKYNVKYVVDLRTSIERDAAPDRVVPGAENIWISVLESDENIKKVMATPNDRMQMMLAAAKYIDGKTQYWDYATTETGKKGYRQFFDILLKNEGATLWHCSAGKDRTGMAGVLVLSALGVDRETILDDFELSNIAKAESMTKAEAYLRQLGEPEEMIQKTLAMVGVERSYMAYTLDRMDAEYGGVMGFLTDGLGLTQNDIEALKAKYLE